jgi:hypothetical protein
MEFVDRFRHQVRPHPWRVIEVTPCGTGSPGCPTGAFARRPNSTATGPVQPQERMLATEEDLTGTFGSNMSEQFSLAKYWKSTPETAALACRVSPSGRVVPCSGVEHKAGRPAIAQSGAPPRLEAEARRPAHRVVSRFDATPPPPPPRPPQQSSPGFHDSWRLMLEGA